MAVVFPSHGSLVIVQRLWLGVPRGFLCSQTSAKMQGCGVCESLLPSGPGSDTAPPLLCCLLSATTVPRGVNQGPSWVCVLCFSYAHSGLTSVGPLGESDVTTHLRELNHPLCVCWCFCLRILSLLPSAFRPALSFWLPPTWWDWLICHIHAALWNLSLHWRNITNAHLSSHLWSRSLDQMQW